MSADKTLMPLLLGACCLLGAQGARAQTIQTVAGGRSNIYLNSAALGVSLNQPRAVTYAPDGTIYIAQYNNVIEHFNPATGLVTTVAGNGTQGYSGDGGPATSAGLNNPTGVVADATGNLYIVDNGNDVVRMVSGSTGVISTIVGNGTYGFTGDGGPATNATLSYPLAVAVDSHGNLYIADSGNRRIRMVTSASGIITTVAGNGTPGYTGDGGPAAAAELGSIYGLAFDAADNLYLADSGYNVIRMVTAVNGTITTVAGSANPNGGGYSGDGGPATSAQLGGPYGVGVDGAGNIYIADWGNEAIRMVMAATGTITSLVGAGQTILGNNGGYSGDGGPAANAMISNPYGIAVDGAGDVYIADFNNHRLRMITAATGIMSTAAGEGTVVGSGDGGTATSAVLNNPSDVAVDGSGNLYIADPSDTVVRKVTAATGVITTIAGSGVWAGSQGLGDGGAATAASLYYPNGVVVDGPGNLYIADALDSRVRMVTAATGVISTVAGNGNEYASGDGGPATSAGISPSGVAVDSVGNLYIADGSNNGIRMVTASTGVITTVAGNGCVSNPKHQCTPYAGDGGPATSAAINFPQGVAVDGSENIYIADTNNSVVRMVTAATGIITTVAGNGSAGYSGDGGPATSAQLNQPYKIAIDSSGNLYIADTGNDVVRMVTAATGVISTVAGNGISGYSGDGGAATSAELGGVDSVRVDSAGNIYIADNVNARIRKVTGLGGSSGTSPPVITPVVTGTLGTNGWYTSNVQVSWTVNGNGTTITSQSGCGTITISTDTAGQVVTCSATSAGGTTTQSVTVKRDTTAPVIAISTPANGASYPQGMIVNASYTCSDATSGVASCSGTTASDAAINTSTMGSMAFTVNGTDQAGNTASASSSYTITAAVLSFSLAPTALSFGNDAINVASTPMSVTLTNTGTAALPVTSIALAGSNPGQFSQTNSCGSSVAQGASCVISVVFLPASTGAKTATLNVVAGSHGTIHSVALTGIGADAGFSLSPASLSFGNQEITVASAAQTVTLTNTGPVPLSISGMAITGAASAQFSQNITCGATVAVGGTCAISVTFTPTAVGSKSATLKVAAGSGAAAQSVSLSGTGTDPTYTLAPSSLAFGNQQTNVASAARIVTVTNASAVALPVTSITLAGSNSGQFAESNTCGASIPAASGCSVSVTFLPTSTGAKTGTLNVNLGGGAGVQSVSLTGTGIVPTYALSPPTLVFGNQLHNTSSAALTITLTNTGTLTLPITTIALAGANPGQFLQTNTCGASVAASATCTINVVFHPTSTGAKSATLKVTPGAGAPAQTTALSGTGT